MKQLFHGFWSGLRSPGTVIDWSANCLGALGLTIFISERMWSEWLGVQHVPCLSGKACFYAAALLTVFCYEGWFFIKRLRKAGRSTLWTILILLLLAGVAGPTEWGHQVHVSFAIAFMALYLPLFADLYFMHKKED
jgi:uncharacterized membrane protein YhaH (DUF805 family)